MITQVFPFHFRGSCTPTNSDDVTTFQCYYIKNSHHYEKFAFEFTVRILVFVHDLNNKLSNLLFANCHFKNLSQTKQQIRTTVSHLLVRV